MKWRKMVKVGVKCHPRGKWILIMEDNDQSGKK